MIKDDDVLPPIYDETERVRDLLDKRKKLEQELKDAEILLQLIRKHLDAADEYIKDLTGPIESKKRVLKITPEMEAEVIRLWRSGERHYPTIAYAVGLAVSSVERILKESREVTPHRSVSPELRDAIIQRFQSGESARAISKSVGYSLTTVSKLLRKAGFETDLRNRERLPDGYAARRDRRLGTMD